MKNKGALPTAHQVWYALLQPTADHRFPLADRKANDGRAISPGQAAGTPLPGETMPERIQELLRTIQELEQELRKEFLKKQKEYGYEIKNKKVSFE
jgi:hypothetical protein